MKSKIYSVQCPQRIQFGDPFYLEQFDSNRLQELIVDREIPDHFEARVLLTEQPYSDFIARNMTICLAPKADLDTYTKGYIYPEEKVKDREIGVDTARYYIDIDGKRAEFYTGADGYWGKESLIFREVGKSSIVDAIIISIAMPEYLFKDTMQMEREESSQIKMEQ